MTDAPKGRAAVEEALITAAAAVIAEGGATRATVREIAARAGVNHGQVHHYFGSKEGLLREAMRGLARDHYVNATARGGGGPFPPPLTVAEDRRYWQAVIRLVLDGELELARVELDDDVSVPRRALRALADLEGKARPDTDLKSRVAASVALQLAWAALEDFVCAVCEVDDDERDAVRRHVAGLTVSLALPEVPRPG